MDKNDYGFCGLYFDISKINNAIDKIDKRIVYDEVGYGKTDKENQHITLLFGFKPEVKINDVKPIMNKFTPFNVEFYKMSLFESTDYDVLKLDVKCDMLYDCNNELSKLPNEKLHKEYSPHLTLAYLNKNSDNNKLIRNIKPFFIETNKL